MSTIQLYRVILPVTNIQDAVDFYSHVLQIEGERVSPGRHYFDCGNVILACYSPEDDGDDLGDGWSFHENQYLYLSAADLESLRERIVIAGGQILTDIEAMPWGETMFYAVDPMGSRISFTKTDTLFKGSN